MANIRVTCPACKTELEIAAEFEGQEVECGNCLEVFKAKPAGPAGSSGTGKIPGAGKGSSSGSGSRGRSSDRPAPKKRRRDDDDDEYEHDRRRRDDDDDDDDYGPPRRGRGGEGDGAATAAMILGIISILVCCCPLISVPVGLSAAVTGGFGLKSQNNKGMAIAGLVMGIIGMGLSVLVFLGNFGNANRFN